MNYNTDGFKERTNYIITENEKNNLQKSNKKTNNNFQTTLKKVNESSSLQIDKGLYSVNDSFTKSNPFLRENLQLNSKQCQQSRGNNSVNKINQNKNLSTMSQNRLKKF